MIFICIIFFESNPLLELSGWVLNEPLFPHLISSTWVFENRRKRWKHGTKTKKMPKGDSLFLHIIYMYMYIQIYTHIYIYIWYTQIYNNMYIYICEFRWDMMRQHDQLHSVEEVDDRYPVSSFFSYASFMGFQHFQDFIKHRHRSFLRFFFPAPNTQNCRVWRLAFWSLRRRPGHHWNGLRLPVGDLLLLVSKPRLSATLKKLAFFRQVHTKATLLANTLISGPWRPWWNTTCSCFGQRYQVHKCLRCLLKGSSTTYSTSKFTPTGVHFGVIAMGTNCSWSWWMYRNNRNLQTS